jgi:hypothetical protein
LDLDPEITSSLLVLSILYKAVSEIADVEDVVQLLVLETTHKRPVDAREPCAVRVGVTGADKRVEVPLVCAGKDGKGWDERAQGLANDVVLQLGRVEGGEEVGCVPSGGNAVLRVVGLSGIGVGEVARVTGEGGVADQSANTVTLSAVDVARRDAGVESIDSLVDSISLGVLCFC